MSKKLKMLIFLLLINIMPLKLLTLDAKTLYLAGDDIGIKLERGNVVINGGYNIDVDGVSINPFVNSKLKKGDLILKADNNEINNINNLKEVIKNDKDNNLVLEVKRDNLTLNKYLKYYHQKEKFNLGLYLKDSILALGTLTYIDKDNNSFGALGHELIDEETKSPYKFKNGQIYEANVLDINESKNGDVGEKVGDINLNNQLGNIEINNKAGVFGYINDFKNSKKIETLEASKIKLKEAYIYSKLDTDKFDYYKIKILKLEKDSRKVDKGIFYEIVDERLIKRSGGIVKGMSGSPIIQDNYLIGAVSHVLNNDVLKGYGIYIDKMLNYSNTL